LPGGQLVGEGVARLDVLDSQRHQRDSVAADERQLLFDLVGIVRSVGKYEHHRASAADRADDRFLIIFSGPDVAAGDPACRPAPLDRLAHRQRILAVGGRIADEHRPRRTGVVAGH
jgi:hypothetical protein